MKTIYIIGLVALVSITFTPSLATDCGNVSDQWVGVGVDSCSSNTYESELVFGGDLKIEDFERQRDWPVPSEVRNIVIDGDDAYTSEYYIADGQVQSYDDVGGDNPDNIILGVTDSYVGILEQNDVFDPRNRLHVINKSTGDTVWSKNFSKSADVGTMGEERIVIHDNRRHVITAFDLNGDVLWNKSVNQNIHSTIRTEPVAIDDGRVYIGLVNERTYNPDIQQVRAYDLENGSELWRHSISVEGCIGCSPDRVTVSDDKVFAWANLDTGEGFPDSHMIALDRDTGDLVWRNRVREFDDWTDIIYDDEKVYSANDITGVLLKVNASTGEIEKRFEPNQSVDFAGRVYKREDGPISYALNGSRVVFVSESMEPVHNITTKYAEFEEGAYVTQDKIYGLTDNAITKFTLERIGIRYSQERLVTMEMVGTESGSAVVNVTG